MNDLPPRKPYKTPYKEQYKLLSSRNYPANLGGLDIGPATVSFIKPRIPSDPYDLSLFEYSIIASGLFVTLELINYDTTIVQQRSGEYNNLKLYKYLDKRGSVPEMRIEDFRDLIKQKAKSIILYLYQAKGMKLGRGLSKAWVLSLLRDAVNTGSPSVVRLVLKLLEDTNLYPEDILDVLGVHSSLQIFKEAYLRYENSLKEEVWSLGLLGCSEAYKFEILEYLGAHGTLSLINFDAQFRYHARGRNGITLDRFIEIYRYYCPLRNLRKLLKAALETVEENRLILRQIQKICPSLVDGL